VFADVCLTHEECPFVVKNVQRRITVGIALSCPVDHFS
jgi:hypothetical protein